MEGTDVLVSGGSHIGGPGLRMLPGLADVPVSQSQRGVPRPQHVLGLSFGAREERDLLPAIPGHIARVERTRRYGVVGRQPPNITLSQSLPTQHVTSHRGAALWASEPWSRSPPVTLRVGAGRPRVLPPMERAEGEYHVTGVHRRNMATALFMAVASSRYSKVGKLIYIIVLIYM